jgi:transposase
MPFVSPIRLLCKRLTTLTPEEEAEMTLYAGIDLHANNSVVVLLNEQDQVMYQQRVANHLPTILEQLAPYHADLKGVVVESTYNWSWLVDGLMDG